MRVLVASRSRADLDRTVPVLSALDGVECLPRLIGDGHGDLLSNSPPRLDAIVFHAAAAHRQDLDALAAADPALRPPLIVVGPAGDTELMRIAMRCGARDFLGEPVASAEFAAALARVRPQPRGAPAGLGHTTVLIGAAGGVGTSFVAANVAHRYATDGERAILVDLDLVCAPLLPLFDLRPALGLVEALGAVDTLDPHAIDGYVGVHHSGLNVLGAVGDQPVLDGEVATERVVALLQRLREAFAQTVVDAGSRLTPLALAAAVVADHVVIVVQQSVGSLRGAARLQRALQRARGGQLAPPLIVINRHQRAAAVTEADVRKALECEPPLLIPNDYPAAHQACDTGVPLLEMAGHAPLTRAIAALADRLSGHTREAPRSLFERALPIFARRSS